MSFYLYFVNRQVHFSSEKNYFKKTNSGPFIATENIY